VTLPLLALLLGVAQADDGRIGGVVFDAEGLPLAGATITVGSAVASSSGDGTWQLVVPAGTVTVRIEAPGVVAADVREVEIASGASTEVLVTLSSEPAAVTIERPAGAVAKDDVPSGPPGVLAGVVTERDGKTPVSGVRVYVRGSDVEATSDDDGRFSLELPSGGWSISAIRAGYTTVNQEVEVAPEETGTIALSVEKTGLVLADLSIRAPRITGGTASVLDERKEASAVTDVIGADQMSKSGDSDAAAALRRVTGLTVIDGKYVYVRGLGDRYSATLLNGSTLPSPEPEKRVVPLDLFPTSLIETVTIQKTFSPDRPAEFGGGVVEVKTRTIPEKPVFTIGLAGGWSQGVTNTDRMTGPIGPQDWLGFGNGWRALPTDVQEASDDQPLKAAGIFSKEGYTSEELEQYGESIENRWGLFPKTLPPDFGASLAAGRRVQLGDLQVGALVGGVYSNVWDVDEGQRTVLAMGDGGLTPTRITTFEGTSNKVRLGGALSLGVEWDERFSLTSTTLLNRSSTGSGYRYDVDDPSGASDKREFTTQWEETELRFEQLALHLDLTFVELDARAAFAVATLTQPDRRSWTYLQTSSGDVLAQTGSWNDVRYTNLEDHTRDLAADLTVPIPKLGHDTKLKLGGDAVDRERESTTRRFGYGFHGSEGIELTAPIEDVMVPDNIGEDEKDDPGFLEIEENTINSDDYSATQSLDAFYGMADAAWTPRFRTLFGLRHEHSRQVVDTFEIFDTSNEPVSAVLDTKDTLPGATLSYGVGPQDDPTRMQLRAGYGRTLSRPEFRELSEVQFYDNKTGRTLYGNPDLERATIDNVDLRWEWYPQPGESLSAGFFYKYFDEPIESIVAVTAVSGSVATFDNATSATNFGAELELRQGLDVVSPDLYFTTNVSLVRSRVDLTDTEGSQTSDVRPLQGQSPWVVNAQLSYENPDVRSNVALLYNVFGPRIVAVGTSGIPDVYDQPQHVVDFVWTQGFGKHCQLRGKAGNILDWPAREKSGGRITEETYSGRTFSASFTWTP
jgi:outer membrane receptor protein involved in Fe transport